MPTPSLRLSVIVPTYRRPVEFWRCLEALAAGQRRPDQIVVTVRDTDAPSRRAARDLQRRLAEVAPVTIVEVTVPGHEAALNAGMQAADGDILVFTDDDAEAHPDWLARIEGHFLADPAVTAVGGQDIVMRDGQPVRETTSVMGQLSWYGRREGLMHQELVPARVVEVDYLKGVNMSYRAEALRGFRFDTRLDVSGASQNEVDLAFFIKSRGGRLIYDPAVKVDHYIAERQQGVKRGDRAAQVEKFSRHYTYIMLKWLSWPRRLAFVAYWFLLGQRTSWGVLSALIARADWNGEVLPSLHGKWQGVQAFWTWKNQRMSSSGYPVCSSNVR